MIIKYIRKETSKQIIIYERVYSKVSKGYSRYWRNCRIDFMFPTTKGITIPTKREYGTKGNGIPFGYGFPSFRDVYPTYGNGKMGIEFGTPI